MGECAQRVAGFLLLGFGSAALGAPPWDAGLLQGGWRSELPRASYGTAADPLVFELDCLFPNVDFALCPQVPGLAGPPSRVFSRGNWESHPVDAQGRFWIVGANAEPAGDARCNSGPPNQSEPLGAPFEAVFGLAFGPPEDGRAAWRNEWRLAIDLSHRPAQLATRADCVTRDYIPYLGVGLASERGADGIPFAEFVPGQPGPLLRMGTRLIRSNAEVFAAGQPPPANARGQHAGIWLESYWAGKRRWIWLTLLSGFEDGRSTYRAPWNWALRESVHAPGAEIVVSAAPALRQRCPETAWALPDPDPDSWQGGVRHVVELHVSALFDCLADAFETPPPIDTPLPLTGIHAWVEVGLRERDGLPGFSAEDFESRLGMAFDTFDVLPPGEHPLLAEREFLAHAAAELAGLSIEQGRARVDRLPVALERSAALGRLLDDPMVVERSLMPVLLQRLLRDGDYALDLLQAQRRMLSARALGLDGLVHQMQREPAFRSAAAAEGGVRLLQARFLAASGLSAASARQISPWLVEPAKWEQGIARGEESVASVALFLARQLLKTPRGRREAEIVALYALLPGSLPDVEGLQFWHAQPDLPERLAEQLYFAPQTRERWTRSPGHRASTAQAAAELP